MSEKRRRLSAMQLCWKNSCQGATVVPTIGDDQEDQVGGQAARRDAGHEQRPRDLARAAVHHQAMAIQARSSRHRNTTMRSQRR